MSDRRRYVAGDFDVVDGRIVRRNGYPNPASGQETILASHLRRYRDKMAEIAAITTDENILMLCKEAQGPLPDW